MRHVLAILLFLLLTDGRAQYWRSIGRGTLWSGDIRTLYSDTLADRLLAGGTFRWILNEDDTVEANGQAVWRGQRWDSLAHRVYSSTFLVDPTHWFLRFQGELYACGHWVFEVQPGIWTGSIARLNEQTQRWEALGCINPVINGMATLVPKEPQGPNLYATGYAGTICDHPESCVFRYDGTAFHIWEPFQQIPEYHLNQVGMVFDFRGMTYMTGLFRNPLGSSTISLMRHNGQAWEYVPGWTANTSIKEISIHNDTLYVAGSFKQSDGAPGNLVACFDGEQWSNMGGGLLYEPVLASSVVWDLEWFHGELYACGRFTTAGGVPAEGIAKWNGRQWCVPPGDFTGPGPSNDPAPQLSNMAVWRDSLYVCGNIAWIDGQPFGRVAQWIGGDAVVECSAPVGVPEVAARGSEGLQVWPLSDHALYAVRTPHDAQWQGGVFDAAGRRVAEVGFRGGVGSFDLGTAAPGLYLITLHDSVGQRYSAKFIVP